MTDFVPASDKLEAVTRLSALTGSPPETLGPGSKERKSALINLAKGLGLRVDTSLPKPRLGREISMRLGIPWTADCWSTGDTITLIGLNRLLMGAHREVEQRKNRAARRVEQVTPARSKLEAVTRISSMTGGPSQTLGPGSKERKSVLTDLANGLNLDVDRNSNKPTLAGSIVVSLGGTWDESCWSTGQTITLEGLNRLLTLAEIRLKPQERFRAGATFVSRTKEAEALLAVLETAVPDHLDARACITEMLEAESTHWAQDEWRGWYFEFVGLPALVNAFGGGPATIGKTKFDYSLDDVWDLKCHSGPSGGAILNSCQAIDECLITRGFGVLVLSGATRFDKGETRQWQRELRIAHGKIPRLRTRPTTSVRRSKAAFTPLRLDAFFVPDLPSLQRSLERGVLGRMRQGRQVSGLPRGPKYTLNIRQAIGTDVHLASRILRNASGGP